jgi:hypothetical protein
MFAQVTLKLYHLTWAFKILNQQALLANIIDFTFSQHYQRETLINNMLY